MILLDEVGRGTGTYDGTAIAEAILKYLLEKSESLILISSHSHILAKDFCNDERVSICRMQFKLTNSEM